MSTEPRPPADRTTRRLQALLTIVLVAAIAVAAIVVLTAADTGRVERQPGEAAAGQRLAARLLHGIPQSGVTLGRADAPVRIVEFADLQCPFCAAFSNKELPKVVRDQIRTGRASIELHLLTILDRDGRTDSARLAAMAYGAEAQHRLWTFADVVFNNQGREGSGYADDAFLRRMGRAVAGLSVPAALRARDTAPARAALANAKAYAARLGVRGTPAIFVGRRGTKPHRVDEATAGAIAQAVQDAQPG